MIVLVEHSIEVHWYTQQMDWWNVSETSRPKSFQKYSRACSHARVSAIKGHAPCAFSSSTLQYIFYQEKLEAKKHLAKCARSGLLFVRNAMRESHEMSNQNYLQINNREILFLAFTFPFCTKCLHFTLWPQIEHLTLDRAPEKDEE